MFVCACVCEGGWLAGWLSGYSWVGGYRLGSVCRASKRKVYCMHLWIDGLRLVVAKGTAGKCVIVV